MKFNLTVMDRLVLSGLYAQMQVEGGKIFENAMLKHFQKTIDFTLEEASDFDIRLDETKQLYQWNKKGQEGKDIEIHPKAVDFLCGKIIDRVHDKIALGQYEVLINFLKKVYDHEDSTLLKPSTLDKVKKEINVDLDDLDSLDEDLDKKE